MSQCSAVSSGMYIRSPLARAVHQKLIEDNAVYDITDVSLMYYVLVLFLSYLSYWSLAAD